MKKIFAVSAVLCLLWQTAACSSEEKTFQLISDSENLPYVSGTEKEVPAMQLICSDGSSTYTVNVFPGTSSWQYDNGDGTCSAFISCGFHPLDSEGIMPEIRLPSDLFKIEISFSLSPAFLYVRRWKDSCIGNAEKYDKDSETVNTAENEIAVINDGTGYIYEVRARWPQGEAVYAFCLRQHHASLSDCDSHYDIPPDSGK